MLHLGADRCSVCAGAHRDNGGGLVDALSFVVGLVVGGTLGILALAVCIAGRED